jgi:hypothetical protein
LREVYDTYRDRGLEILGIAFVESDEEGKKWLREFLDEHRINWTTVFSNESYWFSEPFEEYNVRYLPFYLLLDENGEVVEADPRGARLDTLMARLFPAEAGAP